LNQSKYHIYVRRTFIKRGLLRLIPIGDVLAAIMTVAKQECSKEKQQI